MAIPFVALLAISNLAQAAEDAKVSHLTTPTGIEFGILGQKPSAPAPVLFVLASDVERTLTDPDFNGIGGLLGKQGFICVSLDAPCHGKDNTEKAANELAAWRTRIERGDDLVGAFNAKCSKVLDYLVAEHYADPACVAVAGTSRGGFLALHWAAAEPRVRCVVAFAPVTDLPVLVEFRGTEHDARVTDLAALRVADKLAGRPIWMCIGNDDQRVGTDRAIAFSRAVVAASKAQKKPPRVELHVTTAVGHSHHPTAHAEAAAWVAARMKDPPP